MNVFTPKEYASEEYDSSPQITGIIQDRRGIMYLANASGILEFDGMSWRVINNTNHVDPREFAIDDRGTIYVGGNNELGYLSVDSIGEVIYNSLLHHLSDGDKRMGTIWHMHAINNDIYFQTREKLLRWREGKFRVWNADDQFNRSFVLNDELVIQETNSGLLVLRDNELTSFGDAEIFRNYIRVLIPYSGSHGENRMLIGDNRNNLYLSGFSMLYPFQTKADAYFLANKIRTGIALSSGNFAISTVLGGLVVLSPSGSVKTIVDKQMGLASNFVENCFMDKDGGLWLKQDLGTARIEINSPLTFFTESDGFEGIVLSIIRHEGNLYLATMSGVYVQSVMLIVNTASADSEKRELAFEKIQGITAQCFKLLSIGDELLVATNKGVYQILDREAISIARGISTDLFQSGLDSTRVFIGQIDGIKSVRKQNGVWTEEGKLSGTSELAMKNAITKNDVIWSHNQQDKLTRIDLSDGYNASSNIEVFDTSSGLPSGWIRPSVLNDTVYFGTTSGIYRYEPDRGQFFRADKGFAGYFSKNNLEAYQIKKDASGKIWVVSQESGFLDWESTATMRIPKSDIWSTYIGDEGVVWISNNDGLIRYDTENQRNYDASFPSLIRRVTIGKDSIIFKGAYYNTRGIASTIQPGDLKPFITYNDNSLTFEFAALFFDNLEANKYSYYLQGYDKEWSAWSPEAKIGYTNLSEGEYVFRVKSKNVYGKIGDESTYEFGILTPFYRSWWFYAAQIGFLLLLFGISFYYSRKKGRVARMAPVFATVALVVIFEYLQNYVEDNFEDLVGGITFIKVLVNVLLVFLLLPLETILKKIMKVKRKEKA